MTAVKLLINPSDQTDVQIKIDWKSIILSSEIVHKIYQYYVVYIFITLNYII